MQKSLRVKSRDGMPREAKNRLTYLDVRRDSGTNSHHHRLDGVSSLAPLRVRVRGHGLLVDSALAKLNPEVALLTPVRIPGVRNLPVIHTVLRAPANNLHGMATDLASTDVVVDATCIILEVRIHRKGNLHWATSHDCLLNARHSVGCDSVARVGIFVIVEVVVRRLRISITLRVLWWGLLTWAARRALCRVWVISLRFVVMTVRHAEVTAEALAERARTLILAAAHPH